MRRGAPAGPPGGPGSAPKPAPFWLFVLVGSGAGLVSDVARVDPMLPVVVAQTAGAGLLPGGFRCLAVRMWRRLYERMVPSDPS